MPRDAVPNSFRLLLEMDLTGDIVLPAFTTPRVVLAKDTGRNRAGAFERVIQRQSLLTPVGAFGRLYESLGFVGNTLSRLGQPGGVESFDGASTAYSYAPFHAFEFPFTDVVAEPLAFFRDTTSGLKPVINPDVALFLGLEERTIGSGIWLDPRTGSEVLIVASEGPSWSVEIRTEYLRRYLRARQMCLLTAHFHRVQYFNPPQAVVDAFQEEEFEFGSSAQGLKGKLINAGPRSGLTRDVILFTDLHLWSQVDPPALDPNHPFEEEPTFDVHAFTLPTAHGPVAPARFRPWGVTGDAPFGGATCDFMHPVYFRQEILVRYEVSDGFVVEDDGSVVCRHFWALNRSTRRIGNELIATAIGDFAEGVPIEEWPYWKLHAVEPPSAEASQSLHSQRTIASAVNSLIEALQELNRAFLGLSTALGVTNSGNVWTSSPDSLAGRQLKWFYPVPASEDEFLKRATLLSTFALEGLSDTALRSALIAIARELHLNDENPRRPLGSRRLLQRLTLSATVIASLRPSLEALSDLVFEAERERAGSDPELESELHALRDDVRSDFAPLAFLYDLRRFGGLAHVPNMPKAHIAAKNLGIAEGNWSRTDYIGLIDRISASARKIATTLCVAAETVVGSEKP